MLLDQGRWGDRPIVPADYVDSMTADTVPTDGHVATGASAPTTNILDAIWSEIVPALG